MEVKFYPKTVNYRSANTVKILFKGNTMGYEKCTFIRANEEDEEVVFFLSKDMHKNSIAIKLAQKLCQEKNADVLLMCRPNFFREIIKFSKANMEAHLKYDVNEDIIIYYVIIQDEQSIFLTAYEEWN